MKTLKTIKRPKSKIKNSEPKEPAEKKGEGDKFKNRK